MLKAWHKVAPVEQRLKSLALTLGLAAYLALAASAAYALWSAPRWSAKWEWNGRAWAAVEAEAPVRTGDLLIELGGRPVGFETLLVDNASMSSREQFLGWLDQKSALWQSLRGSAVTVKVARVDGSRLSLELPLQRGNWSLLQNSALMHWPVSLVFFLVGWATCRRSGAGRQALVFYLMCLSMALVYLTNAASLCANPLFVPPLFRFLNLLNVANFVAAPTLLLHFSLLLPRPRRHLGLLVPVYACSVAVILTLSIPGQGVLVPCLFLGSLLAIAQGAWSYRGVVERQQMKWVGAGFLLGVGPWLLANGLPLVLWGERLMTDTLPGACLVFIPLSMAVAVHRYRLFDVGPFLEGTFVYLLTVAVLMTLEVTVLALFGYGLAFSQAHLISLALLLGLYGPLRARLAGLMTKLFHRREVSEQDALDTLRLHSQDASPEGIRDSLAETVRILWAPSTIVAMEADPSRVVRDPGAYLELVDIPSAVLVVAPDLALRCGPLSGGRPYTSQVMTRLGGLAQQSALMYRAASLMRQADTDRRERLEERERLLGDLHDGVGSALANIRILSGEPAIAELAGDALFELQTFLYDRPDFLMEREPFVAEIRLYSRRLFEVEGTPDLRFQVEGNTSGTLSRRTALSLFRLLREAISNALKHAQAQTVSVTIAFGSTLDLTVWDDGRGPGGEAKGRGLEGMVRRVADLAGEIRIETEPGKGVRIEVSLPL